MPTPTITKGEDYFFTTTYEGNGGGQRVGKFVPFTDNGTIDNSCIFDGATAQARVGRTPSSNGSGTILTFSAWVKRGRLGSISSIFITGDYATYGEGLEFTTSNQINYYCIKTTGGVYDWNYTTNRTFEDTSKWYHVYVRRDTTDATAADRIQLYIDGERITSWNTETQSALNRTGWMNQTTYENSFGNSSNASYVRGIGYLAEVNMIDGSSPAVSTFGETDTSTGRWVPKTLTGITYGTNGFRLKFQDSSALGDDTSGNGNDLTATNLASTDQTTDSPTQNHTTLNPIKNSNITLSEGNLKASTVSGAQGYVSGSQIPLTSGKYYSEITITTAGPTLFFLGVSNFNDYLDHYTEENPVSKIEGGYIRSDTGQAYTAHNNVGTYHTYGNSFTTNDVIGIAIDVDKGAMWISKNGTWQNSATASEIADGDTSNSLRTGMKGPLIIVNYTHSGTTVDYNFGQRSFSYTAPTGYNSIQQDNLPETNKGTADLVWIKNRDSTDHHYLADSSRGPGEFFRTSSISTLLNQTGDADGIVKFLKGGVEVEDGDEVNAVNESYVSWNWVGNGGTEVANTDGSGATIASTHQVNTTSGLSIIQWAGTGTSGYINHGLSTAPAFGFVIAKDRSDGTGMNGLVYHKYYGHTYVGVINQIVSNMFYSRSVDNSFNYASGFTNSNITVGNNVGINGSGFNYIGWFWAEVDGFSKAGHYVGNASTNGPFVYTGFKPAFVLRTRGDVANTRWTINDNVRTPFNSDLANGGPSLFPDSNQVEQSTSSNDKIDFLSNGFKVRGSNTASNANGGIYVYMAFAEHPFIGDGTSPATAR